MKTRLLVAIVCALFPVYSMADHHESKAVDAESTWVTAIAPVGDGAYAVGSATGLLLRPGAVSMLSGEDAGLKKLYEHPAAVWTVGVTSDGKTIVSADYRGNLVVYDVGEQDTRPPMKSAFERWCQSMIDLPGQPVGGRRKRGREGLSVWSLGESKD